MAIATRTQLQTHLGRLWDLTSQPAQPLKPNFWEKLDLDGRKASVDQEQSRKFNNESAWDPVGPVQDEWNDSIYPRAIKPLLQHNSRTIYNGLKRQTPYSVCCWMIGREWDSSHPAVVIICGNQKVTKNAVRLIQRHGELARTWGFQVYGYESKVSMTMGASASEPHDESPLCAISGISFTVGSRDGISTRTATLGGSIMLGNKFFGVTVAHTFMGGPQDELSDEYDSDMSDDDSEETDIISSSDTVQSATLESDMAFLEDPISHQRRVLGSIPDKSRSSFHFSQGADWALLELRPNVLAINFMILGDNVVAPWRISESFHKGELWAAVSPAKPVMTKASSSICGLFVPHSGLQDVWALNLKPTPGYCGSWVVDATAEAICGIVVAGSESNEISYALPAHVVFGEIRAHFPEMHLQSLQDIATLPVSEFVNFICKTEELGLIQVTNEMVSRRGSLDDRDSSGWNPLCWAVSNGYEAGVASLLNGGANPYFNGSPQGMDALALAVQTGHVAIVQRILSSASLTEYSTRELADPAAEPEAPTATEIIETAHNPTVKEPAQATAKEVPIPASEETFPAFDEPAPLNLVPAPVEVEIETVAQPKEPVQFEGTPAVTGKAPGAEEAVKKPEPGHKHDEVNEQPAAGEEVPSVPSQTGIVVDKTSAPEDAEAVSQEDKSDKIAKNSVLTPESLGANISAVDVLSVLHKTRPNNISTSNTPQPEYGLNQPPARSPAYHQDYLPHPPQYYAINSQPGGAPVMDQAKNTSRPATVPASVPAATPLSPDLDSFLSSLSYPALNLSFQPQEHDMAQFHDNSPPPVHQMYAHREWPHSYGQQHHNLLGQTYSFVPIPGAQNHIRPRRRYEEIERMYKCGWNGCEKAYGTLNHLNAHVVMQSHGAKRTPEEFKEIRKEWKACKKEEASQREAAEERERAAAQAAQAGQVNVQPSAYASGVRPQLPPIKYQPADDQPSYVGQTNLANNPMENNTCPVEAKLPDIIVRGEVIQRH